MTCLLLGPNFALNLLWRRKTCGRPSETALVGQALQLLSGCVPAAQILQPAFNPAPLLWSPPVPVQALQALWSPSDSVPAAHVLRMPSEPAAVLQAPRPPTKPAPASNVLRLPCFDGASPATALRLLRPPSEHAMASHILWLPSEPPSPATAVGLGAGHTNSAAALIWPSMISL